MKRNSIFVRMSVIVLALWLAVIGCPASGAGGNNNQDDVPVIVPPEDLAGNNALSEKTYFETEKKIEFSKTAEGEAYGTYKTSVVKNNIDGYDLAEGKYKYRDYTIGKYYWNEEEKTVLLVPEQVVWPTYAGEMILYDEAGFKNGVRQYYWDMRDDWIAKGREADAQAELEASGYATFEELFDANADYEIARAFKSVTNYYAFSTDGVALFLDEKLPPNVGTNELIIGTYTGMTEFDYYLDEDNPYFPTFILEKDPAKVCKFDANGEYSYYHPTYYDPEYRLETGTYSYNSTTKQVWLKRSTAGRDGAWTAQRENDRPNNGHNFKKDYFENVDDYNAAVINSDANRFRFIVVCCDYDMEEGTIWSKDYYIN